MSHHLFNCVDIKGSDSSTNVTPQGTEGVVTTLTTAAHTDSQSTGEPSATSTPPTGDPPTSTSHQSTAGIAIPLPSEFTEVITATLNSQEPQMLCHLSLQHHPHEGLL